MVPEVPGPPGFTAARGTEHSMVAVEDGPDLGLVRHWVVLYLKPSHSF